MEKHTKGCLAERTTLRDLRPVQHTHETETMHASVEQSEVSVGIKTDGTFVSTRSSIECGGSL